MRRPGFLLALVVGLAVSLRAAACGAAISGSSLALPLLGPGEVPQLTLAQRTITRAWGPSEDSTYVEVSIPDWKSEGWAAAASAALPGSGQWYVGAGSAIWFALAEVAGWTALVLFNQKADDYRDDAETFAGNPADSASTWSFERWESATGSSSADLQRMYEADPDAFYHNLAYDPAYTPGWQENVEASRLSYKEFYDQSQRYEMRAGRATGLLVLNHVISAVDALHAARVHNIPLQRNLKLSINGGWHDGPRVRATLVRKF